MSTPVVPTTHIVYLPLLGAAGAVTDLGVEHITTENGRLPNRVHDAPAAVKGLDEIWR